VFILKNKKIFLKLKIFLKNILYCYENPINKLKPYLFINNVFYINMFGILYCVGDCFLKYF
jgi:hypothetical protein